MEENKPKEVVIRIAEEMLNTFIYLKLQMYMKNNPTSTTFKFEVPDEFLEKIAIEAVRLGGKGEYR